MKKHILLIIICLTVLLKQNAQTQKLSAVTQLNLAQPNALSKLNKNIKVLIEVNSSIKESSLTLLGVKIHTKINQIWSVSVPIGNIASIAQLKT